MAKVFERVCIPEDDVGISNALVPIRKALVLGNSGIAKSWYLWKPEVCFGANL